MFKTAEKVIPSLCIHKLRKRTKGDIGIMSRSFRHTIGFHPFFDTDVVSRHRYRLVGEWEIRQLSADYSIFTFLGVPCFLE
jgi:hypothetical protein